MSNLSIPSVIWPNKSEMYKVVQIDSPNGPILRFGINCIHSDILLNLAGELRLETVEDRNSIPRFKNREYKIVGAGRADLSLETHFGVFNGYSSGYLLEINKEHLRRIQSLNPDWELIYEEG